MLERPIAPRETTNRRVVVLTGVTGFLGKIVLYELLRGPERETAGPDHRAGAAAAGRRCRDPIRTLRRQVARPRRDGPRLAETDRGDGRRPRGATPRARASGLGEARPGDHRGDPLRRLGGLPFSRAKGSAHQRERRVARPRAGARSPRQAARPRVDGVRDAPPGRGSHRGRARRAVRFAGCASIGDRGGALRRSRSRSRAASLHGAPQHVHADEIPGGAADRDRTGLAAGHARPAEHHLGQPAQAVSRLDRQPRGVRAVRDDDRTGTPAGPGGTARCPHRCRPRGLRRRADRRSRRRAPIQGRRPSHPTHRGGARTGPSHRPVRGAHRALLPSQPGQRLWAPSGALHRPRGPPLRAVPPAGASAPAAEPPTCRHAQVHQPTLRLLHHPELRLPGGEPLHRPALRSAAVPGHGLRRHPPPPAGGAPGGCRSAGYARRP